MAKIILQLFFAAAIVSMAISSGEAKREGGHECICTKEYRPVCGSDGKTYPNRCVFTCALKENPDLTIVREGPCSWDGKKIKGGGHECICPTVYDPVCGTDGKTYPNKCALACAKKHNPDLDVAHEGKCEWKKEPLPA